MAFTTGDVLSARYATVSLFGADDRSYVVLSKGQQAGRFTGNTRFSSGLGGLLCQIEWITYDPDPITSFLWILESEATATGVAPSPGTGQPLPGTTPTPSPQPPAATATKPPVTAKKATPSFVPSVLQSFEPQRFTTGQPTTESKPALNWQTWLGVGLALVGVLVAGAFFTKPAKA